MQHNIYILEDIKSKFAWDKTPLIDECLTLASRQSSSIDIKRFDKLVKIIHDSGSFSNDVHYDLYEISFALNGIGLWYFLPKMLHALLSGDLNDDVPLVDALNFHLDMEKYDFYRFRDLREYCSHEQQMALGYYLIYALDVFAETYEERQTLYYASSFFFCGKPKFDLTKPKQ